MYKVPIGKFLVTLSPPISTGGFGSVHKAECQSTGKQAVAKQFRINSTRSIEFRREMVNRETTILKKLKPHPNIVTFYDYVEDANDVGWIFMEYCDQGNLYDHLEENRGLGLKDKIEMFDQCASAISFMHLQKPPIVHRDIKLTNILLKKKETQSVIKIADFGISKCLRRTETSRTMYEPMNTRCGSDSYMAPELWAEQGDGLSYCPAIDIFALGLAYLVLFENGPDSNEPIPLSVESKRSGIRNEIGKEMKMKQINGEPLPTVIEHFSSDSDIVTKIKNMIAEMIEFNPSQRTKIEEVHATTLELLQNFEEDTLPKQHRSGSLRQNDSDAFKREITRLKRAIRKLTDEKNEMNRELEQVKLDNIQQQNHISCLEKSAHERATKITELEESNAMLLKENAAFKKKDQEFKQSDDQNRKLRSKVKHLQKLQDEEDHRRKQIIQDHEKENELLINDLDQSNRDKTILQSKVRRAEAKNLRLETRVKELVSASEETEKNQIQSSLDLEKTTERLNAKLQELRKAESTISKLTEQNNRLTYSATVAGSSRALVPYGQSGVKARSARSINENTYGSDWELEARSMEDTPHSITKSSVNRMVDKQYERATSLEKYQEYKKEMSKYGKKILEGLNKLCPNINYRFKILALPYHCVLCAKCDTMCCNNVRCNRSDFISRCLFWGGVNDCLSCSGCHHSAHRQACFVVDIAKCSASKPNTDEEEKRIKEDLVRSLYYYDQNKDKICQFQMKLGDTLQFADMVEILTVSEKTQHVHGYKARLEKLEHLYEASKNYSGCIIL